MVNNGDMENNNGEVDGEVVNILGGDTKLQNPKLGIISKSI